MSPEQARRRRRSPCSYSLPRYSGEGRGSASAAARSAPVPGPAPANSPPPHQPRAKKADPILVIGRPPSPTPGRRRLGLAAVPSTEFTGQSDTPISIQRQSRTNNLSPFAIAPHPPPRLLPRLPRQWRLKVPGCLSLLLLPPSLPSRVLRIPRCKPPGSQATAD